MKKQVHIVLTSIISIALVFTGCEKFKTDKNDDAVFCSVNEAALSTDSSYQDFYNWQSPGVEQYILEEIVVDPTCNCIVSGYVKYLKDGKTVALVQYGDGTCDSWAIKINCVDGSCAEKAGANCTKFEQDCETE